MRKKPWYKGRWGIVLIVLGFLLFITACSGTTPSTEETGTQEKTEQAAPKEEKTEFNVGEVIQLRNHQLTVNSVNKNYPGGEFDKPEKPENIFVVINATLTNNSEGKVNINEYGFKLEDETGTQRNTTFLSTVQDRLQSVTLSPNGGTTSGNLVFEAKLNSKVLKLHYSPGIAGGKEITVNL